MESEGRRIHGLAAEARESGNHLEALKLEDEAMLAYQRDGDIAGFAEVLADRSLVLRHLHDDTGDRSFLILAGQELVAAVEITRNTGNRSALAIPLYNLAKNQEDSGNFEDALKSYRETLEIMETNPPETHNRHSILADMKIHMITVEYLVGDKTALERALKALEELENIPTASGEPEIGTESKYNKDVWVSGGYMRLAYILKDEDPARANEYLQKAKEVIDSNPELTIRLSQWEKLAKQFD